MRATAARSVSARLILTVALAAVAPSAAGAVSPAWPGCEDLAGFECTTVAVPLDRDRPSRGTIPLAVSRVRATENPTGTAVVALAGGPGQAALPLRQGFASALQAAITSRDLLVFDQRGTGSSGRLSCSALRTARTLLAAESGCAAELGAARGLYRSVDSVADLEAVRVAGGYDRLLLYGVSYGTKVAQLYAATHPDRVERLILDSTVPVDGPDPLRRASLRAIPRVLRELCSRQACRRATPDVAGDLTAVVARLERAPVRGTVVTAAGSAAGEQLDDRSLLAILVAGDLNPALRAELPGSLRAARGGDWAPLLRLSRRAGSGGIGSQTQGTSDAALFLATTCEEAPFPWTRTAGPDQRWAEARRAAAAVPAGERAPFSSGAMLATGPAPLCVGWPAAGPYPEPPAALPPVPTLVLSGRADLRTPLESAERVRDAISGADLLPVPAAGHSVLSTDVSGCARAAVAAFVAGTAVPGCASARNRYTPTPRPPLRLGDVTPSAGVPGRRGRAIAAVLATITDARRQVVGTAFATGAIPARVGALRSGTVAARTSGDQIVLTLRRYAYLPRLAVSGRFVTGGGGTVTATGAGVRARLRVSASGAATGTVNGRRVRTAAAAARLPGDPPVATVLAALDQR